jgi:hypothetical protein
MKNKILIFCISLLIFSLIAYTEKKPFVTELVLLSKFGGLDVPREQILANPCDLNVSSEGFIYILDSRDNNIKAFKKDGTFIECYGQQGQGPGEFRRPWTLSIIQDKIHVTDTGNRRVQVLSKGGDPLRSYSVPVRYGSGMGFDEKGNLFVNTQGFRSPKLIAAYDNQGNLIAEFGDLEGDSIKYYDFILIKKQIKERKIPDSSKNDVLLISDNKGNFFAVHRAINKIKKFSSTGTLLKETEIKIDEFQDIYKEFLRKNEGETNQSIFWPLIYINDLAIDKLGNLYLLLNSPSRMIICVFSNDCEFLGKLLGVEDSIFRIDISNDDIMFALSQETQFVYEFSLNIN